MAPLPFPKRDLLEAREALDLAPPLESDALWLFGSYETDLDGSTPGFFIILPGYGIEDDGVRLIEHPKLVARSIPDTPLSPGSPLFPH
jgi:hypothetical protein